LHLALSAYSFLFHLNTNLSMKKIFTNVAAVLTLALVVSNLSAQQLWPTTDSATIRASQFADTSQIFVKRTGVNVPSTHTGWVTEGIKCTSDPSKKDNAVWRWSRNGRSLGPNVPATVAAIASPTLSNGAAYFDSDYLSSSGIAPADIIAGATHGGDLISPPMRLTGNRDVSVVFNHFYYSYYEDIMITWSEDNGRTWKDTTTVTGVGAYLLNMEGTSIEANTTAATSTFLRSVNGNFHKIRLKGAVGTDSFRIKFIFDGDGYFWALDDVRVFAFNNDMQLNRDWFASAPNFITPRLQAEPMTFMADISNQGSVTQPNVRAQMTITNSSGATVFTGTRNYGSIKPDSLAENELFATTYTPDRARRDRYVGVYRVLSDSVGQYRFNDTARIVFSLSDTLFQKDGGGVLSTRPSDAQWASGAKVWSVGNYFYVPKGKGWKASTVSATIGNASQLGGKTVDAYLYEWKQPLLDSGIAKKADLTLIGAAQRVIPTGTANFTAFSFALESTGAGNIIALKDSTAYIVLVGHAPGTAADAPMTMTFDTRYDYGGFEFASRMSGKPRRSAVFADIPRFNGNMQFNFFGTEYIPVVRWSIQPINVSTKELSNDNKFDIYPNPVSAGVVNFDIDLAKESNLEIRIMTLDGKVVQNQSFESFDKNVLQINVSELAAATYIAQITTDEGVLTKRFVVTK
jgi:hypothetical protein